MTKQFNPKTIEVIRALAQGAQDDAVADGELLARYAAAHDERAFAVLVRRHAAMVQGIAKRVLGQDQDAEDVCQATFLLLARKAARGLRRESVAGWLCATARLTALNAHRAKTRRTRAETRLQANRTSDRPPLELMSGAELVGVLDEELARLPDRYRGPLVLCCLEGLSRETAARRLAVPAGTLRVQLERARAALRRSLEKRGIELGVALLAVTVASSAKASPKLLHAVMTTVGGTVSPAVATLTQGGMLAMTKTNFAFAAVIAFGFTIAGAGAKVLSIGEREEQVGGVSPQAPRAANASPPQTPGTELDLAKIGRAILREPAFQTKPRYGLLTFGPEAKEQVWLVLDGNTLYVDRNGNGDLTENGERIAPKKNAAEGELPSFEAGDIQVGGRTHKNLRLIVRNLKVFVERDEMVKKHLEQHPDALGYSLVLDVATPGRKGGGAGERVERYVLGWDKQGVLSFGDTPRKAPVMSLDGPLQICLFQQENLIVGRANEVFLGVGTPGSGPGTTSYIGYEGVVPNDAQPRAELVYAPKVSGASPQRQDFKIKQRCCTYNFWDSIHVPTQAGEGEAQLTLSFADWKDGHVRSSTTVLQVIAPKPGPKYELVSEGLKGALMHSNKTGILHGVRYSPDGKRIIAGDYPGGIVQVWDVASGKTLTQIETGSGLRSSAEYFLLSPDWRTMFVSQSRKRQPRRFEKEEKPLTLWECEGDVRAWDLQTGTLINTYEHNPSRAITWMGLTPDASAFVTFDQLSGEAESGPRPAVTIWNATTKQSRPLPGNLLPVPAFSPDSKTLALQEMDANLTRVSSIKLFDVATGAEKLTIPIAEKKASRIGYTAFSPDGSLLVAQVRDEAVSGEHLLKFWDVQTGQEVAAFVGEKQNYFMNMAFDQNGHTLAVTTHKRTGPSQLLIIDLPKRFLRTTVTLGNDTSALLPAFSRDGKWIAVGTQAFPNKVGSRDPDISEFAQGRIHLIEAATGVIHKTLVPPPGIPVSLCFSPDGQTLASSGNGRVLLWDVSNLPQN